jgi:hypothetical protein
MPESTKNRRGYRTLTGKPSELMHKRYRERERERK